MSADQYDRNKPILDPWCPNCRQPWPTDEQAALQKSAEEYFAGYFETNYYGTVVFGDPRWHAPRVFRAALWALHQAKKDAERAEKETRPAPCCDINATYPGKHRGGCPQETPSAPYDTAANFARSCTVVPPGHFWRGVPESNRHQCRNCGEHYDKHLHTDEASRCPTANRRAE